jgi:hypothetical protein
VRQEIGDPIVVVTKGLISPGSGARISPSPPYSIEIPALGGRLRTVGQASLSPLSRQFTTSLLEEITFGLRGQGFPAWVTKGLTPSNTCLSTGRPIDPCLPSRRFRSRCHPESRCEHPRRGWADRLYTPNDPSPRRVHASPTYP